MKPILLALPGNDQYGLQLAQAMECEAGDLESRRFPDGEFYLRILSEVKNRDVALLCTMNNPDEKLVQIHLAAGIARDLGAHSVGLIAPYLAYMRQDSCFKPGEGKTSGHIARMISACCDWLVTVDPHLHRHHSLDEIYTIPTKVVQSAPAVAEWISKHVSRPVIVGPDAESEQWASKVAAAIGCPQAILQKTRYGDREVEVSVPDTSDWSGCTPVVVDDIASSGRTMLAAVMHLNRAGMLPPVCIAVHPVFAGDACKELAEAGVGRLASCNTIMHHSNEIDLTRPIANASLAMITNVSTPLAHY
ncbi:ribose-phosphate pyrophosphokinase [Noviherbaspirillum saxi]|uniref:ribose-phosphate diphosphokinase n=1 Tax=Noviherbaspirillum saxi TaxID=2320863 RepID=A0A3A3G8L9_9BURK|nr:ribose-phosphate pyrophosphokinase [Noviherbaspirillum saxi]RJF98495.1 ribose-phosphate pyrophosphokinase [Noviherbaspirillum saxi]